MARDDLYILPFSFQTRPKMAFVPRVLQNRAFWLFGAISKAPIFKTENGMVLNLSNYTNSKLLYQRNNTLSLVFSSIFSFTLNQTWYFVPWVLVNTVRRPLVAISPDRIFKIKCLLILNLCNSININWLNIFIVLDTLYYNPCLF